MARELLPGEMDSFGEWVDEIDTLSVRFLGHTTGDLYVEIDFDAFDVDVTPEEYFSQCIVPELASQHGHRYIDALVGNQAMWGDRRPSDQHYDEEI